MKIFSNHIDFVKLVGLVDQPERDEIAEDSAAHLAACEHCSREFERLDHLINLMRTDTEPDAPRDLVSNAISLFPRTKSAVPSAIRRIVAALSFDSSDRLVPAFGVRAGQAGSRQLIYAAGASDLELRIIPREDQWVVAGQFLGDDQCAGGEVTLESGTAAATAAVNELCEFTLPQVPAGNYRLLLRFDNIEIEVPQLELRA